MTVEARQRAHRLGHAAEWRAVWRLRIAGYTILARRYKTRLGEIDIVAREGDVLVVESAMGLFDGVPAAPGRSGDFLYLGDTGNNFNRVPRRSAIQIYRIPEPVVDLTKTDQKLAVADAERIELVYPEGKVFDCESVLVDPHSGELVLITKDIFAGPSYVFRTPAVTAPLGPITLTQVTDCQGGPTALHFPAGELPAMTGADITAAGDAIIGRAYSGIYLWNRLPGESIGAALGRQPCALPAASEKQGEAVGFAPDGATYYTVSEGAGAEINVFRRN